MDVEQAIEAIIAREWQPEWRAGVEHYAVGQHVAFAITEHPTNPEPWEPDAILAFVPSTGHGVTVIPCMLVGGEWCALDEAFRVLCAMTGPMKLPIPFDLSDRMKAALDATNDSRKEHNG